jgi:two-component system chemotaxis response regulator CheB
MRVIVIGGSAGGVESLREVVGGLPATIPAAILVVIHFPADAPSVLPRILSRAGPLPAQHAVDGAPIEPGRIYVARPGFHLLVRRDRIRVARGPTENGHRPAIDPLFRSAAIAFGPRVIGVLVSGNQSDGTAGLAAIKQRGGIAVVQDPDDALFSGIPRSALDFVAVDHVAPAPRIGALLAELVREESAAPSPQEGVPVSDDMRFEAEVAEFGLDDDRLAQMPGRLSPYGCPACGGTLWQIDGEDALLRFRCRVGHAYSAESLSAHQAEAMEGALWSALRALEESASLARQVADRMTRQGIDLSADRFRARAASAEEHADVLRRLLTRGILTSGLESAGGDRARTDALATGATARSGDDEGGNGGPPEQML